MGVARELETGELDDWIASGQPYYYIAHQMAVDQSNKTTPIRVVFNSSQKFAGRSLNRSWSLGPDLVANLQVVLLRFRSDVIRAQGVLQKTIYMINVSKPEEMMQLWFWKFKGENTIRTFSMTRLVMRNRPSSNISVLAVRESTNLQDFRVRYPDACKTLLRDSYVDNVFVTAPNIEVLFERIGEVEEIASAGGFKFKPWMVSGEINVDETLIPVGCCDVEKVLGMYWDTQSDKYFVKLEISSDDWKILFGSAPSSSGPHVVDAKDMPIPKSLPLRLTLRISLSLHSRIFDLYCQPG